MVERELRAIARRPSAYWVRSAAALAAFVAMGYVALVGAVGFRPANQGRNLFEILSFGAFAYCLLAGIRGTSDALSQEKREGTLGLLFLTDLKGHDVVFGKLVSVSINSIYGILAVAPLLALAFMMGGTTATQFLMMIAFLLNTLFFSLSVGIFVSTFSQHDRPAMGATFAILFVALVMPYGIAAAHSFGELDLWDVMEPGFLLPSPAFAFWTIKDWTLLRALFNEVLLSLAFIHLAAWLCLVVASACIAQRAQADAPRGKVLAWFAQLRQQWAYGKAERRRAIRRGLLNRNAFAWLAGRDRLKQRYAWTFLLLLAALWLIARWKAPEITEEWPAKLLSLWFLHLFFKVWVASEVAARFIEDRRSNALELLLTTPLKLREFAAGECLALLRQFGAPLAAIILLNIFCGMRASDSSAFLIRSPHPMNFFGAGLVHLVVDLYAIYWVAIWRSLHLRGTNRTITQTIFLVVLLPASGWFFLWQGSWLAWMLMRRGGPSAEEILWTWTILCVLYDVTLALIAQHAFFRDFREIATKAFDKPAPFSWKNWKARRSAASPATQNQKLPQRRWTARRQAAVATLLILIIGFGVITIRRGRLQATAAARIAAIRAGGFPLNPVEAAVWLRTPPANESASAVLREASKALLGAPSRPAPQLLDSQAKWNSREKLPPDLKRSLSEWVMANDRIYQLLDQLPARKPGGPMKSERYWEAIPTDDFVHVLQFKARVEMEDDPRAAAHTISILLHFARTMEGEQFQSISAARKAMQGANDVLERAMQQGGFSENDWRAWKKIIAQLDPIATLRTHLVIDRARGVEALSMPLGELHQNFARGYPPLLFSIGWSIRRLFGQDQLETILYLDEMAFYIAQADKPFWQVHKAMRSDRWTEPTLASRTLLAPQLLPAFNWLFNQANETVAYQRILICACDVEIFRAQHGKLPGDLAEVSASTARTDPFSGGELHFIVNGDEYSIYSVAGDMHDDGGARISAHHKGDITFNPLPKKERR